MDLTFLWYLLIGLGGGVIYVFMPPMVTDARSIVQHIVLGAAAGIVTLFGLQAQDPAAIGTPLSYIATLTAGYLALDVLKNVFGPKPSTSSSGLESNIPP